MRILLGLFLLLSAPSFASSVSKAMLPKIKEYQKEIDDCVPESFHMKADGKMKIVLNWEVDQDGEVPKVSVDDTKSTLLDPSIQICVIEKFKSLKFPPAPEGQIVKASYPFVITPFKPEPVKPEPKPEVKTEGKSEAKPEPKTEKITTSSQE